MDEMRDKLIEVEQRAKSNTRRIDKLEQSTSALADLATAVKVMVTKQEYIADRVDCLNTKVTELESRPAKRWEAITEKAIITVVAALIGFALARMGLG